MKKGQLSRSQLRAPEGEDNIHYWRGVVARQMTIMKSYHAREDAIAFELGKAQKNPDHASVIIEGLLGQTLAVAKRRVQDREEALALAVKMLTIPAGNEPDEVYKTYLPRIKELCPDLFSEPETPLVDHKDPEVE